MNEELKNVDYSDFKNIVFSFELTYSEILNILDMKYIDASSTGYTLPPGIHELTDIDLVLKSLPPDNVKLNITIDDIRLRPNLTRNKILRFTKKSFFYTNLGFTQNNWRTLVDIEGFVQIIPGIYRSDNLLILQVLSKFI